MLEAWQRTLFVWGSLGVLGCGRDSVSSPSAEADAGTESSLTIEQPTLDASAGGDAAAGASESENTTTGEDSAETTPTVAPGTAASTTETDAVQVPISVPSSDAGDAPLSDGGAALSRGAELDRCVRDSIAAHESTVGTGVGVAIVEHGETVLAAGYGLRDREQGLAVDANTSFAIGSASKAFGSLLVAQLVDDGVAHWDEPIATALPAFATQDPAVTANATIVDLLAHRTGLPRHDLLWSATTLNAEEIFQRLPLLEDDPEQVFRASFQYNNLMYLSAALWLQALTARPWQELLRERVLTPLGMTDSAIGLEELAALDNVAVPYRFDLALERASTEEVGFAGALHASANDMAQWLGFLAREGSTADGSSLVTAESLEMLFSTHNQVEGWYYGLGWSVADFGNYRVIAHGGSIRGFLTSVFFIPEQDVGVAIMVSNDKDPLVGHLLDSIVPCLLSDAAYEAGEAQQVGDYFIALREQTDLISPSLAPREPNAEFVNLSLADSIAAVTFTHPAYGEMTIHDLGNESYAVEYFDEVWPATYLGGLDVVVGIWRGGQYAFLPLTYVLDGEEIVAFDMPLGSVAAPSRFTRVE